MGEGSVGAEMRKRRILVVDDEAAVRRMTIRRLAAAGYEVVGAGDADEAEAMWRQGPPFDLLVTDQSMPGLSGRELAEKLRAERAGLPVIITTGLGREEALAELDVAPGLVVLCKPYGVPELLEAVRGLL